MTRRIHIFGASGSGTTTLAKAIAGRTGFQHFDTDDFFWMKTDPPFTTIREESRRQGLLKEALLSCDHWVLSGSLCGWGNFAIPMFDLVVFLLIPPDVRMQRLKEREIERYGPGINDSGHPMHKIHRDFLAWAKAYDTGGTEIRSKQLHEEWLSKIEVPVLRIEGNPSVEESVMVVLQKIFPDQTLESAEI
jgi:adenylate kinase family enzyme